MNVLFLDQFSEPGGAQLCLIDLLPEVIRRGWRPRVMAPGGGKLIAWCRETGVPTAPLPLASYRSGAKGAFDALKYLVDLPRMALAIRTAVRDHGIDLIYVNGPRVLPALTGLRCPVIFHTHNLVAGSYPRRLLEWSLRRTEARVIAISRYVMLHEFNPRLIYNGVPDLARGPLPFERVRSPAAPRIGIVGRIAPEKGHLDFVSAGRLIRVKHPSAEFVVYGASLFSDRSYDRAVRKAAADSGISFRGWVQDVGEALRGLDILAVPSGAGEPATRVIMEAFSAGTPVVAYASGGIPELVENGLNGILTERSDADSLAASLCHLLENPTMMRRLSAAGRDTWKRRFSISRFQSDICNVMAEVVREAARSGPRSEALSSYAPPPPAANKSRAKS